MIDYSKFAPLEDKINVTFRDKDLLVMAFTHRSYINENRGSSLEHNERLEFLGDAVLELVVTEFLFAKFPDKPEGELTSFRAALVNTTTLSALSAKLGFNEYLLLSRGEAKDTGRARQYILANTFEAVIGATYLDQGYEAARGFIERYLFPITDDVVEHGLWQDAKSRFQEKSQEIAGITPTYKVLNETGPDHDKSFISGIFMVDEKVAEGEGQSKQEAEQAAARAALKEKNW